MKEVMIILIILFCLAFGFACEKGQARQDAIPITVFDPNRDAAKDIELAKLEARQTGKHILLDVGGNWCIWCRRLDQFFAENEDINRYLHQNFVLVKINFSPDNRNKEVLSKFPSISGYPHLFVLDESGNLLHSQSTADLEDDKSHDRKKVQKFLTKWAPDMDAGYTALGSD
jgi:thioredoxin-related protein